MKKKKQTPALPWRLLAQGIGRARVDIREATAEFDELVVADWFHLERMDTRCWWMQVGEENFDITIPRTGPAVISHRKVGVLKGGQ